MKDKTIISFFCLSFAVLTLCALSFSKEKIVESAWAANPLIIDGSNADWQDASLTLYKRTEVEYAFRNDAENLYVLFVFKNPREFMSSIRDTGMTVWLNTEAKNSKDYGIRFAIKTVSADNYIAILEEMMKAPMPEEKKKQIQSKPTYQVFHNEVIDKEGEAPPIVSGPTAPAFDTVGGRETVTYEFKIPLRRGEGHPVGIGTEPGNTIRIGFEWGGTTKDMRQDKLKDQTAQGATGTAESGTGTLTGERGVAGASIKGGLDTMSRLRAAKYIFWADVKLADKQ